MEAIIAFLLSALLLAGDGSMLTSVDCQAGPVPAIPVAALGYECWIEMGGEGQVFVLTGMLYFVEAGPAQREVPEIESY